MPRIDWTVDAGMHQAWIDEFDRELYRNTLPTEVAQERREDFDLLNVRVVDTYGHDGYIKCFELTFAERVVQIEVGTGDGRNWRDFDLSDPANAEFLANLFMAVLKRPHEIMSARYSGRNWQARISPEHRPAYEVPMTYTGVYATPVIEGAPTWRSYDVSVPNYVVSGDDFAYPLMPRGARVVFTDDGSTFHAPTIRVSGIDDELGTFTLTSAERPDGT